MSEEYSALRREVESCLREALQFDEKMCERSQKRRELINSLKGVLPSAQYKTFEKIMNETNESIKKTPSIDSAFPVDLHGNNTLEKLQKIRTEIEREVYEVMGVSIVQY